MASILIPVYNERGVFKENIQQLMDYMDRLDYPYELVVCSNGSTDGTDAIGEILERENPGKVKFISVSQKGVGLAFKKMVEAAGYDKLVSMDVDLTTELDFIPECIRLLDEYDIVLGSKRMGEQQRHIHRIAVSKGYRKEKIKPYLKHIDEGSSYVVELVKAVKEDDNIIEIPVVCNDSRESKFNLVHEIFYRFKNLLSFWIRFKKR